jgi:hypothetical protein
VGALLGAAALGYILGESEQLSTESVGVLSSAEAAGGIVAEPTGTAPDRYVYYPGTEALARDEIRIIAGGTGMPDQDWHPEKEWYEEN